MTENILQKLLKLRRGNTPYGKAPHKPVMLLSILDMFDEGLIVENRVPILPELVAAFRDNWALLVTTQNRVNFNRPFYHLSGDKIWRLVGINGKEITTYIDSFKRFDETVAHGEFEASLFEALIIPEHRSVIRQALLDHYFPDTQARFLKRKKRKGYFQEVESSLLEEGNAVYQTLLTAANEEEQFVRKGVFKKVVPRIYNYTCAITGMRVDSIHNISMIDACHIIPFSRSGDDTIRNGIALCPNLHRAFDRGLVGIDSDYRVIVSKDLAENSQHPYSLRSFAGKPMQLPFAGTYHPHPENFAWHRAHVFLK